ncbi:MAG: hypothetical protein ACI4VH_03315 [Clostridia bacterium]
MPEIPNIAERIIEFEENDFIINPKITGIAESLSTEAYWQIFADNALTFTDGNGIFQFAEEYPIVRYQCKDEVDLMPDRCLNAFVKSITVSSTMYGKKFSISAGKVKEEKFDSKTVVYYEDNIGRRYAVLQYDIIKFLLRKPKLVVSSEGLLIFFTKDAILVTNDCEHYAWINEINTDHFVIEDVELFEKYSCVCLVDTEEANESSKHHYKLQIDIDIRKGQSGMIKPRVEKL